MTQEEKARRYDEALERARKLYERGTITESLGHVFPELKESEDERIRKALICHLQKVNSEVPLGAYHRIQGVDIDDILAWLEKQKEFVSADFDDVWEWADCDELTAPLEKYSKDAIKEMCHAWYDKGIELERKNWLEKQGEKKPTDKVEPKFKVGDFILNDYCIGKVIEVTNDAYLLDSGQGIPFSCEHNAHLWTIQDAKDGDVRNIVKTEEVRQHLEAYCRELERDGFYIRSARFKRNEQTRELEGVQLSYDEPKDKEKQK